MLRGLTFREISIVGIRFEGGYIGRKIGFFESRAHAPQQIAQLHALVRAERPADALLDGARRGVGLDEQPLTARASCEGD